MEKPSFHARTLKRLLFLTIIALFIIGNIALIGPTLAQTTSVSVSPGEVREIAVGETFTIDLYVADVVSLNNWEVFLGYNTTILDAKSVTWGPFNPTALMPYYIIDDAAGLVKMYYLGESGATVSGSGVIVTVEFTVTGVGESILDIGTWNSGGAVPHNWLINTASTKITHDSYNGYFNNRILGDVNGDGKVDASDLFDLSNAYGSHGPDYPNPGNPASPKWNLNCDLNKDNKVDASDLFDLSKNYGKSL